MWFHQRVNTMRSFPAFLAALLACLLPASAARGAEKAKDGDYFVYIGTYTRQKGKGIYAYRFQPAAGKLTPVGLAGESDNPSFLAVHPNRRFLYAVNEMSGGKPEGYVSAFAIDPKTGKLAFLNKVSSRGGGPCHLMVDKSGKHLAVANYNSGSVAVFPVLPDGRLGEASAFMQHRGSSANPARQKGPHAHCVLFSPDNRFLLAADLGLDQVLVYRFDATKGSLAPNDPPSARVAPGSGPRHLAFHPKGSFLYVNNEMASTVTAFAYQPGGGILKELQTVSTLPAGFSGESTTAEIETDRAGKFLYVSNRGHDSIAVFAIDAKGALTPVEYASTQGKVPRSFALDPTGAYLFAANQDSYNVVVFRVDSKTGRLTPSGQVMEDVGQPVCVVFAPVK
jgi:6-phosphogluconolactonase